MEQVMILNINGNDVKVSILNNVNSASTIHPESEHTITNDFNINAIGRLKKIQVMDNATAKIKLGFSVSRLEIMNNGEVDYTVDSYGTCTSEIIYLNNSKFTLRCQDGFNIRILNMKYSKIYKLFTKEQTIDSSELNELITIHDQLSPLQSTQEIKEIPLEKYCILRKFGTFNKKDLLDKFMKINEMETNNIKNIIKKNWLVINGILKEMEEIVTRTNDDISTDIAKPSLQNMPTDILDHISKFLQSDINTKLLNTNSEESDASLVGDNQQENITT